MRVFAGLVLALAMGVNGCSETAGAGGSGGSGGIGGTGGNAGAVGESCVPSEQECLPSEIDPIVELCEIVVPDQASACSGTESIENPTSCTASGNTVRHKLKTMQIAADCNAGFDLDGCDGKSCAIGGLAQGDGVNGVDNGLAASGATLVTVGDNLGAIDQVFHDAMCTGGIDVEIEVDAVEGESCAVVKVSVDGVPGEPIPMNLSGDGCLSGALGTIPIGVGEVQGTIENAVVRMTVSSAGLWDGVLGGTADESTALAVFMESSVDSQIAAAAAQFFDISGDLSGNSQVACDSLSMTFEIGGDACPSRCDDGDICTKDACDPITGACAYPPSEDGTLCGAGLCVSGECVPIGSVFPCNELGIRLAVATGGGPYTFSCDGPTTVATKSEIVIDNDVILDGGGMLTVDGNDHHRVFQVLEGVTAELDGFTVTGGLRGGGRGGGGAGISNDGTLTLANSTVSGNEASFGGGIRNNDNGTLTLTNSTVSGNEAGGGSGVSNWGKMTLTNSTVSTNTAGVGGTSISNAGTLTLANSVIEGDCGGAATSNGYNIESPGDTCGFDQPTDQVNVSADDLKLGPLQDNGGPTMTHALGVGSVAIDVIPADECVDAGGAPLTTDQRGVTRPQGSACDVGAVEMEVTP